MSLFRHDDFFLYFSFVKGEIALHFFINKQNKTEYYFDRFNLILIDGDGADNCKLLRSDDLLDISTLNCLL